MTSLIDEKQNFKSIFFDFIKSSGFAFILCIITLEFFILDFTSFILFTESQSDFSRIIKVCLQILITIPFAIIIYTYIFWRLGLTHSLIKQTNYSSFLKRNLLEWILVQIRAFARIIMFSFLLIIPGIIESMRMCFSSLNVFYNKNMGSVYYDPLLDSRKKLNPFTQIILVLFLLTLLIPLLINLPFSERSFFAQPFIRGVHTITTTLSIVFSQCFIFYKYTQFYTSSELTFKEQV